MDESLRLLFAEYFRLPWAENWPDLPANAASPPPSATFQNSGRPGFKDIINADRFRLPGLEERIRTVFRTRHYSCRTEQAYTDWSCRFMAWHDYSAPADMDESHVRSYLDFPAVHRQVSVSTQRQALNAVVFFFTKVFERELGDFGEYEKVSKPKKLPFPSAFLCHPSAGKRL
ncbi:MAG: site-specific integrase [Desulfococcaceae bacterium]|jgi:hypothetical protein|nr:site-specific integrase [Desulfococcaceae bacterium]